MCLLCASVPCIVICFSIMRNFRFIIVHRTDISQAYTTCKYSEAFFLLFIFTVNCCVSENEYNFQSHNCFSNFLKREYSGFAGNENTQNFFSNTVTYNVRTPKMV